MSQTCITIIIYDCYEILSVVCAPSRKQCIMGSEFSSFLSFSSVRFSSPSALICWKSVFQWNQMYNDWIFVLMQIQHKKDLFKMSLVPLLKPSGLIPDHRKNEKLYKGQKVVKNTWKLKRRSHFLLERLFCWWSTTQTQPQELSRSTIIFVRSFPLSYQEKLSCSTLSCNHMPQAAELQL